MSDNFNDKVIGLIKILLPDTEIAVESKDKDTELVFSVFNLAKDCVGVIKVDVDEGKPIGLRSRRGIFHCQIAADLLRQLNALILSYNLRGNNA